MIKSTYHIAKNASTIHIYSELYNDYCPRASYKDISIIYGISHILLLEQ